MNSMAYDDCQYHTDWMCQCRSWVNGKNIIPGHPVYCETHIEKMLAIDRLEQEINAVIDKARRK